MIGDGYFQLRAQIGTSLFSLNKLARDFDGSEESLNALQALQGQLREPFVFLTLGPSGAGKSTLLNTLFGREFAGGAAFTRRAVVFRYGTGMRDQPVVEEFVEAQRPYVFLRDFTIVDTPGLDAPAAGREVLTRFLPATDLVLFVFPIKGGVAEAWDFLAGLDRDHLRRFIFIVQGCDLVTPDEVLSCVKRLRQTMLARLNYACPIFSISAHTRAGMEKLERYIENEVVSSSARCQRLREVCQAGRALLLELGTGPQTALRIAEMNAERCENLRLALVDRKDQSLRHVGGTLWPIAKIFEAAQRRGEELLRLKLTPLGIRQDSPEWWSGFHREVEERCREGVRRHLELSIEHFEADLTGAWEEQQSALQKFGIQTAGPALPERPALLARFVKVLAERDLDNVTTLTVSRAAAEVWPKVRLPAIAALVSIVLLLVAWLSARFVAGGIALVALTTAAALCFHLRARRKVFRLLRSCITTRRESVLAGVEEEVRNEIHRFYRDLGATLDEPLAAAAREKEHCAPALIRVHQLSEVFDKCLADIDARTAPIPPPP